jgi:hypothetical protein
MVTHCSQLASQGLVWKEWEVPHDLLGGNVEDNDVMRDRSSMLVDEWHKVDLGSVVHALLKGQVDVDLFLSQLRLGLMHKLHYVLELNVLSVVFKGQLIVSSVIGVGLEHDHIRLRFVDDAIGVVHGKLLDLLEVLLHCEVNDSLGLLADNGEEEVVES